MKNQTKTYKWAYLPFIFSSAAVLITTSATAAPYGSQQYQPAKQVNSVNHEYVGGSTQAGVSVTDQGDIGLELNHAFSETANSSTSVGLWADYDVKGDDKGLQGRGVQLNHNWVSRDNAGRATRVNKVTAAYDRSANGHDKATVGYGQETKAMFWEGHVSKGLSDRKKIGNTNTSTKAYDYGVGGSVGTFLEDSNMRVRAGVDHEWSNDVGIGEKRAKNTTLSAGVEKFFQGTPHSLGLDVAASKKSGGLDVNTDTDVNGRLSYRYDFGGASIYQPDRRYKRVRVEVPGQAVAPRYAQQRLNKRVATYKTVPTFKRVPTYKNVPTYKKVTVRKPYKQLVKSSMALEGQSFFKLNSAKIIPSAKNRLKQIAAEIRRNGYKGAIRITGNTCGLGNAAYDQRLSEQRANAVRQFLIQNGFNPNHLVARGLGKSHPKFPNTPEQGFKNRRVDIEYVTERKAYKTGYRTETRTVQAGSKRVQSGSRTIQTGSRRVATGFRDVPAGAKNVMISSGRPGSPRVIWKTEVIPTSPAWIKRALHNNIKHNRSVNTFTSTDKPTNRPVNTAPVANNDAATYSCGTTPRVINLVGNDTDANGDDLIITQIDQPQYGTAVINADGKSITYTPDGSGCGQQDVFNYTISDGNGGTATASVTVNIDSAPVDNEVKAVDDARTTDQNTPIMIDVLNNDDDDATITRIVRQPSNGTVEIVNGQIKYTPAAGFTGTDTFDYEVRDPQGNLAVATVTVTVNGVSNPTLPVASDDSVTLETCSDTVINVLANDNQGSGNATVEVTSGPSNGTTEVLANGRIKYTPNDDYVGTDSFEYTITDSNGNTSTATVNVNVTVTGQCQGGNVAPVANDDAAVAQCDAVTINVLGNDTDNDGDSLEIIGVGDPSLGTVTYTGNTVVYTPVNSCGTGNDSFTYTISDGHGHEATATIRVDVQGNGGCGTDDCNNDPISVGNDSATTQQGTGITIDVLANDDSNLMIKSVSSSSNGYAEVVAGKIAYLPNSSFLGTDSFTYTVKNSAGETAQGTVTVTVEKAPSGPNRAPNAVEDSTSTDMNKAITLDVLANDTDPDGDTLTLVSVGKPLGNATAVIVNGKVLFTPGQDIVDSISFQYTISDGNGHTSKAYATIAVSDPNDGNNGYPDIKNETVTTKDGVAITIDVLANDTDPDGDTLILDAVDSGNFGTTHKVGNKILYTPIAGMTGTDTFYYGVHDGHGHNGSGMVTVHVVK